MNICHFTNTFLPHVGGVARAVQTIMEDQRRTRNRVKVIAPEFPEGSAPRSVERSVVRIPALTNFNDSSFSVRIPGAAFFADKLNDFPADIIHAHHPFLLGDTALREATSRRIPVIFTHHTLYEHYVHYLPLKNDTAGEIAAEIATRFANRCAAVIAPSDSVRDLIISRGVKVPVHVLPTGIDVAELESGEGQRARKRWSLTSKGPIIGHIGRLAEEKNLVYLTEALCQTLRRCKNAQALIVGDGPARETMQELCREKGVYHRVVFTGKLTGAPLRNARAAMDLFAFASHSETQGLVLAESMATGTPVVALDASGVREIVRDRKNGRLLSSDATVENFTRALTAACRNKSARARWSEEARASAARIDRAKTNDRLLQIYRYTLSEHGAKETESSPMFNSLQPVIDRITTEGKIVADITSSLLSHRDLTANSN